MSEQEIVLGDCLEVLRQIADNSLDGCITDPPYGLSKEPDIVEVLTHWLAGDDYKHRGGGGFMNNSWDSFVPGPSIWKEVYRVLKPGAYLFCFCGTRTVDLMGISIRLGGFEIRDSIHWIFGSGFPKSLNIAKAIDDEQKGEPQGGLKPSSPNHGKLIAGHLGAGPSTFVKPEFRGYGERENAVATNEGLKNRCIKSGKTFFSANPCRRPKPKAVTEDGKKWEGWGTALKPAHEIILVARKSLVGTVVKNVLTYGTGGLNIDACRVATNNADENRGVAMSQDRLPEAAGMFMEGTGMLSGQYEQPSGRWPANVVLTHSIECLSVGRRQIKGDLRHGVDGERSSGFVNVGSASGNGKPCGPLYGDTEVVVWECVENCPVRVLDEQSGKSTSTGGQASLGDFRNGRIYGNGSDERESRDPGFGDTGGASRFFYCPKASRQEREMGCESLPVKTGAEAVDRKEGSAGLDPRAGAGRTANKIFNHHATVKPIALLRWLSRLISTSNTIIIDPFVGSGSLLCAAALEGVNAIGIEKEIEYVEIAKARLIYWKNKVLENTTSSKLL